MDDLSIDKIRVFLLESGSELYEDSIGTDLLPIAREIGIVSETGDEEKPLNVGILMFSGRTQKYFPCACIEIATQPHSDGKCTREEIFTGTLQEQLGGALEYIRNNIIE